MSQADQCGNLRYGVPVVYDARQYVTRVDWSINQKHQLYGRYLHDSYDQPAPWNPNNYLYTTTLGIIENPQTFVLGETFTINPRTLNSFHFTFGRRAWARFSCGRERRFSRCFTVGGTRDRGGRGRRMFRGS